MTGALKICGLDSPLPAGDLAGHELSKVADFDHAVLRMGSRVPGGMLKIDRSL